MTVKERVAALRALMKEQGIDAYIIPSADNHQSEYVGEHFKCRSFISGFTGSAGDVVVTMEDAGLWTDSRYFIQAEKQLAGSGIRLFKMREPGVPEIGEYLQSAMPEQGVLAFDGRVIAMQQGRNFSEKLKLKGVTIRYDLDLIDQIWTDRPPLSQEPAFVLEEKYAGESTASKLARLRREMRAVGADTHVLTTLDDICWLINLRGNDIAYSPMVLSYAVIGSDYFDLFIDESKLDEETKAKLRADGITLHQYNGIYEAVKCFSEQQVLLIDPAKTNYALYNNIPETVKKIEKISPVVRFKAVKNEVEIENIIKAHIKDGVAITKFMYWLKHTVGHEKITEISASGKLDSFRQQQEHYLWQSFAPICGYREHGAIVHYSATPETDKELDASHMVLMDTGGNYYEGSTDITRTYILGDITEEERRHFTTVARSMISLAKAKFLYGCSGYNLDVIAKLPMWEQGLDYKHGTGHGVGYLLSIHEGPAGFRWQVVPGKSETSVLEPGMVITDEPGVYIEGSHGIRLENELIVRNDVENEYGQFMKFEAVTFAPIDLDGIDPELMKQEEKDYLNAYHEKVYEVVAPHLNEDEREWLKQYTRKI